MTFREKSMSFMYEYVVRVLEKLWKQEKDRYIANTQNHYWKEND
jgi:hypothetical protein